MEYRSTPEALSLTLTIFLLIGMGFAFWDNGGKDFIRSSLRRGWIGWIMPGWLVVFVLLLMVGYMLTGQITPQFLIAAPIAALVCVLTMDIAVVVTDRRLGEVGVAIRAQLRKWLSARNAVVVTDRRLAKVVLIPQPMPSPTPKVPVHTSSVTVTPPNPAAEMPTSANVVTPITVAEEPIPASANAATAQISTANVIPPITISEKLANTPAVAEATPNPGKEVPPLPTRFVSKPKVSFRKNKLRPVPHSPSPSPLQARAVNEQHHKIGAAQGEERPGKRTTASRHQR